MLEVPMATPFETGLLLDEFPYIRLGNGPRTLLAELEEADARG